MLNLEHASNSTLSKILNDKQQQVIARRCANYLLRIRKLESQGLNDLARRERRDAEPLLIQLRNLPGAW